MFYDITDICMASLQYEQLRNAINVLPRAVLQQSTFNSKEEYSQTTLKWMVIQLLTYLRIQHRFWRNLLDVAYVTKCLKMGRKFWSIVMAIVGLHPMTYLLHCVDL